MRNGDVDGHQDSRDLLITQLKREIVQAKSNGKNVSDLTSQLANLEQRYNLLQDEKSLFERESRKKYDTNLRKIATLKADKITKNRQLEQLNSDYDTLLSDLGELETLNEEKCSELTNLKSDENEAVNLRISKHRDLEILKRRVKKLKEEKNPHK